jgi:tRNA1Val (adenine37-N6)-methyltransferase
MSTQPFEFKEFKIYQDKSLMKIGTDGVLLGAWANIHQTQRALDIGAGTGVIAIMLAQRKQDLQVDAVEIDEASFLQCRENMEKSPWSERLQVFHQSIQEYSQATQEKYDLIISNPPFFSGGTLSASNGRNKVRHTVKLPNGELLRAVRKLLLPQGRFSLILPYLEGLRFQELALSYNLHCSRITEVRPKAEKPIERLLLEFAKEEVEMEKKELVIQYEGRNNYTEGYIELTRDFYLFM